MSPSGSGVTTELAGWGRSTGTVARLHHAASAADITHLVGNAGSRGLIARGLGRSGGDAAQNGGGEIAIMDGRSSLASPAVQWVDWERRVARLAAGASLADVSRELLAQGWFLPVAGRTAHVTVGGAVACDLHGPSHRERGSLSAITLAIEMIDGRGERITARADDATYGEFFAAFGGMGLTGIVIAIEVRVIAVSSAWMLVDTRRCETHAELLEALAADADSYPYSFARVDTAGTGSARGRGVVSSARHAAVLELPATRRPTALEFTPFESTRRPRQIPNGFITTWTARAVQEAWFRTAPTRRVAELQPAVAYFHGTDEASGVLGWQGQDGLLQYQFVVPDSEVALIDQLLARLQRIGAVTRDATLWRFGSHPRGPLSFSKAGWSLSLEFPTQTVGLGKTLDDFDEQLAAVGGRVFLASDSRVRPSLLDSMYPELTCWRRSRFELDPLDRFASDLSRRLSL